MSRLFDHAKTIVYELVPDDVLQAKMNNKCSEAVVRRFLRLCDDQKDTRRWTTCSQYVSLFTLEECRNHKADWLIMRRHRAMQKAIAHTRLEKDNRPVKLELKTRYDADTDDQIVRIEATFR